LINKSKKVDNFPYYLTDHCQTRIQERGILLEWICDVIQNPQKLKIDPDDPSKLYAFKTIPEYGNRVLRVIYNKDKTPWTIISVYFDRNMKGKL